MEAQIDYVMTAKEVSEYLRISLDKVYELCKAEEIPSKKVGGQWRFSRLELEEWLRTPEASSSNSQED